MAIPQASGFVIDTTTILSLLSTLAILVAAYLVSLSALPRESAAKLRFLFIWHAFDALIHFILEGSYLWNCFFSYLDLTNGGGDILPSDRVSEYLPPDVFFLGRPDRVYGAEYGTTPFSALWREYAKADRRWGGSDLTVISLELLTVFGAGPLACWICWNLSKSGEEGAKGWGRAWFWMVVLATGELYGEHRTVFFVSSLLVGTCSVFLAHRVTVFWSSPC